MSRWHKTRQPIAAGAAVMVAICAAACGSTTQTTSTASGAKAGGVVTLHLLVDNSPSSYILGDIVKAYDARTKGVNVEVTYAPEANFITTAKLQASAPNAPDLIVGDFGPGSIIGTLAQAHLVIALNSYARQYGWLRKYGDLSSQLEMPASANVLGTGSVWGLPTFPEVMGIFYNKARLAHLQLQVPQTLSEFQGSLMAAKKAGLIPIAMGGGDQWPWSKIYTVLAGLFQPPGDVTAWVDGKPGASIESTGFRDAAALLTTWTAAGYFGPDVNGTSDPTAIAELEKGKALYKLDGPWAVEAYQKAMGNNVGFFLVPPRTAGASPTAEGSLGYEVAVTSKSQHPQSAAAFVNFLSSPTAQRICIENYELSPVARTPAGIVPGSALAAMAHALATTESSGGLMPDLNNAYPATPPYNINADLEAVAGKQTPVDSFLTTMQTGWTKFHSGGA